MDILLRRSHPEENEDGRSYQHPGYEERKCVKCGRMFIVAVTSLVDICSDPKDDKLNVDG